MPSLETNNSIYAIRGRDIAVEWATYDFSDEVAGIPDLHIRTVMLDSGVMYVANADPKIRVSHLLSHDLQGLSAAHEELCMEQKVAACSDVEDIVIDAIETPDLQTQFIATRLRMFGALCMMDGTNQQFAATHQLLTERADALRA